MSDICVASHHDSISALLADPEFCSLAERDGFLIELRLDYYVDLNFSSLDRALKVFAPNVVATYRHSAEGGKKSGVSDAERLSYLQHAADHGAKYIDIELRTPKGNFRKGQATLIASFHDFEQVPSILPELKSSDADGDAPADILKIAVRPRTTLESASLLRYLREHTDGHAHIVLGMGEAGLWTRIVGPLFGAPFTYARGVNAAGTAPGQLTWRELDELYRFRSIKPGWPVYGVIGNPIAHSLSPLMHNTALRELNLDGVYIPFKVEGDPLEFVKAFAPLGLRGLSITIPHKEANWSTLAEMDPIAEKIGAVNTLALRPNGTWWATNTDAAAAADSLLSATGSLDKKTVVIIGAGGAARAAAFGIRMHGAEILVLNRTRERAEALAKAVDGKPCTHAELGARRIDALVNTTPLGMHPNVDISPLDENQIPAGSIVFDTVYNPLRTKLLKLAHEKGCKTIEGVNMFIAQGLRQFALWTGKTAPRAVLEAEVLRALKR